jgi:hypothetical protein
VFLKVLAGCGYVQWVIAVIAAPIASAETSCDDTLDIPATGQYFEEHSVEGGWGIWWEGGSEDLRSLDVGFSTEMEIENDSANAISMELVPGYLYTFCITLVADSASPPSMGAIGDVYLMTESNWNRYTGSYADREWEDLEEVVNTMPVEWRDMFVWLPFRDDLAGNALVSVDVSEREPDEHVSPLHRHCVDHLFKVLPLSVGVTARIAVPVTLSHQVDVAYRPHAGR